MPITGSAGAISVAMHMRDGLLNAPSALVFGAVAVIGLAIATVGARRDLDDRTAPMAGLVAAFVFAPQMLNFPLLPGVSGHLPGGARAPAPPRALDAPPAPMAGLVAAFVFATQMLNFPILPGVSGHLLGGALAAILAGPYVGAICVSIVLLLQALLFADGGLSALGTNITNMALIGTFVGYGVAVALRRVATRSRGGL